MTYLKEAPTLKGDNITLRKIIPHQDNPAFYEMFLEEEMHLWTGNQVPKDELETLGILCKYRDSEEIIAWSIIKNDTQEFIGTYWVAPVDNIITNEAQRISKRFWRKGLTKEARKLVYDFLFYDLEIEEIFATAWENNINSCKSMETIGFELIGSKKNIFQKQDKELIENRYILRKKSWKNRFLDTNSNFQL